MESEKNPTVRRGRGEGSVYLRKDGRWVAAVDVGWTDIHRVRRMVYADSERAAKKALRKMLAERDAKRLLLAAPTVATWLTYWLDDIAAERVRPSTLATYRGYVSKHVVPTIGRHRLDRLEPSHLRQLYRRMRDAGMADASVRQTHAIVRRALEVAVREGRIAVNPAGRLDPPRIGRNPRSPLSLADARAVLAAAAGDPYESRWYAALLLGLRQGEALGLSWANVDLERGELLVDRALQRVRGNGLVFVPPKTAASVRRLPVPTALRSRLAVAWAEHVAAGGSPDALVWSNGGRPIDPSKDTKHWTALLARAKVDHVALHAARNTAASLLLAAGVPETLIAEILGHASVRVTEAHYLRGDLAQRAAAVAQLERAISADG